jgi:hypothetical protein
MRLSAILVVACAGSLVALVLPFSALAQSKPAEQRGAPSRPAPAANAIVAKFSILSQTWHRYPGLAVADITFQNGNDMRVRNAVISCEFVDPQGKVVATRGSTVFQSFPPGKKKVDGIEFSLREKNAAPGSCRVISVNAGDAPN